eukprot:352214_1
MASWNDDGLGMEDVPVQIKDWKVPLFGCGTDSSTFIYACMCPCISAGEIYKNAQFGGCCEGCLLYSCCAWCTCCCCSLCHPYLVTSKIRKTKGIRGSLFGDCFNICFCRSCQMSRELMEVRSDRAHTATDY